MIVILSTIAGFFLLVAAVVIVKIGIAIAMMLLAIVLACIIVFATGVTAFVSYVRGVRA